jgi:hypothetical protein
MDGYIIKTSIVIVVVVVFQCYHMSVMDFVVSLLVVAEV